MNVKEELAELKYQYDKNMRVKESLQKNYERRKKLNLLDDSYEDEIRGDIREAERTLDDLKSKIRKLESQSARSKVIEETNERSPWEK